MATLLSTVFALAKARCRPSGEGAGNPNQAWLSCCKRWVLPCISTLTSIPVPSSDHPEVNKDLPSLDHAILWITAISVFAVRFCSVPVLRSRIRIVGFRWATAIRVPSGERLHQAYGAIKPPVILLISPVLPRDGSKAENTLSFRPGSCSRGKRRSAHWWDAVSWLLVRTTSGVPPEAGSRINRTGKRSFPRVSAQKRSHLPSELNVAPRVFFRAHGQFFRRELI